MAFPCWHFCRRCKKDWFHSIENPCAELDPFFQPCKSCALIAEPLREPRRVIPSEDVEDVADEHVSTDGEVPNLVPDDLPEEIELPELTER
jgi:hypothetical protein